MSEQAELLNCKQLANALGRSDTYVLGMRRAGYVFEFTGLGKTTLRHALDWFMHNPSFKAKDYLTPDWKQLPKLPSAPMSRPA